MRIGLLSDTHGFLDEAVFEYFAQCDEVWHAGDFGPVALNVWALDEVHSDARGLTSATGTINNGYSVYASLSFRLWAPESPAAAPKLPLIRKWSGPKLDLTGFDFDELFG